LQIRGRREWAWLPHLHRTLISPHYTSPTSSPLFNLSCMSASLHRTTPQIYSNLLCNTQHFPRIRRTRRVDNARPRKTCSSESLSMQVSCTPSCNPSQQVSTRLDSIHEALCSETGYYRDCGRQVPHSRSVVGTRDNRRRGVIAMRPPVLISTGDAAGL
jgi:hypothetical protein